MEDLTIGVILAIKQGYKGEESAILITLGLVQVRTNLDGIWMYVNGFHDFEFKELKLTVSGEGEWK